MDKNKILNKLKGKKNFVGFSEALLPVIVGGRETDEVGIRVYVRKKEPLTNLRKKDVIPEKIDGVRVDIVEVGDITALTVDKTAEFDEIPLGCSVGHIGITAGSLGLLCYKDGVMYAASNAHVLTPDSSLQPEEISEKRICQPGIYHHKPCCVCGEYRWHKRVIPLNEPPCPITRGIVKLLNGLARLVGSSSRFYAESNVFNHIDFAVYIPSVRHINRYADDSFDPDLPIVGLLFAGSQQVGIICKAKYMMDEGFSFPAKIYEPKEGDKVGGCSFHCSYRTTVTDPSATIQVSYGSFIALFSDVIMVANENVIKGGWSGSSWRYLG